MILNRSCVRCSIGFVSGLRVSLREKRIFRLNVHVKYGTESKWNDVGVALTIVKRVVGEKNCQTTVDGWGGAKCHEHPRNRSPLHRLGRRSSVTVGVNFRKTRFLSLNTCLAIRRAMWGMISRCAWRIIVVKTLT